MELYLHSPYVFITWCLLKHRDVFFFYYLYHIFPISAINHLLLVPRNFSRGRGVVPSLAERGEQSCQRGYYQFEMLRLGVRSGV
jgi:hypothetical protein